MDAETRELLQDVSREIAEGLARLVPAEGPGLLVQRTGQVVMIRPATEGDAVRRVGRRGFQQPEGFYAT